MEPNSYRRWLRGGYHVAPSSPRQATERQARAFVKAVVQLRLGYAPHYGPRWNPNPEYFKYELRARNLRALLMEEDYPINP